jgi:hypothetical protein
VQKKWILLQHLRKIGLKFLRDDNYKFLKRGEELPDVIQKLLGKGDNLRSSSSHDYSRNDDSSVY